MLLSTEGQFGDKETSPNNNLDYLKVPIVCYQSEDLVVLTISLTLQRRLMAKYPLLIELF